MSIFKLIFFYGVVITIFNVIWFFIEWLIKLLVSNPENYTKINSGVKVVSISILSLLLAHESNLFTQNPDINENHQWLLKLVGAFVLYIYIVGKSEKKIPRIFANVNQMNLTSTSNYPKWLPYVGLVLYVAGLFLTSISDNGLTNWFHGHIFDIYNTFFLKLIFGVIAFFFMLNIISKAFGSFSKIGQKPNTNGANQNERNEDDFDDYEIIDDTKINE